MGLLGLLAQSCWRWASPHSHLVKVFSFWTGSKKLQDIIDRQEEEHASLANAYLQVKIANEAEKNIGTCKTIEDMLEGYRRKKFRCVDMVVHYSSIIHQLNVETGDLISEYLVRYALSRANMLDQVFQASGHLAGPLHGVPILISDECELEGSCKKKGYVNDFQSSLRLNAYTLRFNSKKSYLAITLGCPCRISQVSCKSSPFLETLIEMGAIPLFKTAVSWHLLFPDPVQPIASGKSFANVESRQERKSLGGRSGTLSYIMANTETIGCLVGITTEQIGGARISAHHHGLFALKGTSKRYSPTTREKVWDEIETAVCPITKTMDDLVYLERHVLSRLMFSKDPDCIPIPFDELKFSSKRRLRMGYFTDNMVVRAFPGAHRAVMKAVSILESFGHEMVPIDIPIGKDAFSLLSKLFPMTHPATKTCLNDYGLEQLTRMESIFPFVLFMRSPQYARSILSLFGKQLLDDGTASGFLRQVGGSQSWLRQSPKTKEDLDQLRHEIKDYKGLFQFHMDSMRSGRPYDLLISPVHACPPLPTTSSPLIAAGSFYSSICNLIDYPSGVVPNVTQVQSSDVLPNVVQYAHHNQFHFRRQYRSDQFNFLSVIALEEANHAVMEGTCVGVNLGVQVIGRPFEEENVLYIMKTLQDRLSVTSV